jgi:hypothetical protein
MIIEYNWHEFTTISSLPEGHMVLLFALYVNKSRIDKKLSANETLLMKKLNIDLMPNSLIFSKRLIQTYNGIFSNYKCKEPQNYITNCSFLHSKYPSKLKSNYLYILGQRSLANKNTWIPKEYVDEEHHTNPFITLDQDKLIFKLEKQL